MRRLHRRVADQHSVLEAPDKYLTQSTRVSELYWAAVRASGLTHRFPHPWIGNQPFEPVGQTIYIFFAAEVRERRLQPLQEYHGGRSRRWASGPREQAGSYCPDHKRKHV
jgi:hypothetical protein